MNNPNPYDLNEINQQNKIMNNSNSSVKINLSNISNFKNQKTNINPYIEMFNTEDFDKSGKYF